MYMYKAVKRIEAFVTPMTITVAMEIKSHGTCVVD